MNGDNFFALNLIALFKLVVLVELVEVATIVVAGFSFEHCNRHLDQNFLMLLNSLHYSREFGLKLKEEKGENLKLGLIFSLTLF